MLILARNLRLCRRRRRFRAALDAAARHTYRRNDGSWTLRPWEGDARRTLVVYRIDMEPDTFIPDFLLRRLQSATVREVFPAVRQRVGRCASSAPPSGCAGGR